MAARDAEHEIVITRELDAPRDLVWKVWTEAEHVEAWWGPEGFTTRVSELDVREGGRISYVMVAPDGKEYPGTGVFTEVAPPERLVTTDEFGDDFEAPPGMELPTGLITQTYIFEDLGAKTRLTIRITHASEEDKRRHEAMGVIPGWNSSLDCLGRHLAELV